MDDNGTKLEQKVATYSLSLKGNGIALDREIDESTALDVISLVMSSSGGTVIDAGEGVVVRHQIPRPARRGGQGQSLREYMDEVSAKRQPDKILAIAKFTMDETGKDVTREQVKARFQEAAEGVPGNYGRDFRWVLRNGWLALADGSKTDYYVTKTGEEALAAKFSDDVKKRTGVSKGRRGGRRGGKQSESAS